MADLEETKYGFRWGQVLVERAIDDNERLYISIRTKRQVMDVAITPTGLIRPGKPNKNPHTWGPWE